VRVRGTISIIMALNLCGEVLQIALLIGGAGSHTVPDLAPLLGTTSWVQQYCVLAQQLRSMLQHHLHHLVSIPGYYIKPER
jgi:hypothetical protein